MYSLELVNEWNRSIKMTQNEKRWQVTNVSGLDFPAAVISTSSIATLDGSRVNSRRLDNRNVVIGYVYNGDVEKNRGMINDVVMPKRYIKVLYRNKSKDVYIEGYVETSEYNLFEKKASGQISIICPGVYWLDRKSSETILTQTIPLFEFPCSIPSEGVALSELMNDTYGDVINGGNVESGTVFELSANRPVFKPKLVNVSTGQTMQLDIQMLAGDHITISTVKGSKHIVLERNGQVINIINTLAGRDWITLVPGYNRISYGAESGAVGLVVKVSHRNMYGGV